MTSIERMESNTSMMGAVMKMGRFAASGLLATSINIGLYLLLVNRFLPPVPANLVAYCTAVVINFLMHRYVVFQGVGSVQKTFFWSMLASAGGLALDTILVGGLNYLPFFACRQWLVKASSTTIVFFYNFVSKQYIFEKT